MIRWYRVAVYGFMLLVSASIGGVALSLAMPGPAYAWVFWAVAILAGTVVGMALWGLWREVMCPGEQV